MSFFFWGGIRQSVHLMVRGEVTVAVTVTKILMSVVWVTVRAGCCVSTMTVRAMSVRARSVRSRAVRAMSVRWVSIAVILDYYGLVNNNRLWVWDEHMLVNMNWVWDWLLYWVWGWDWHLDWDFHWVWDGLLHWVWDWLLNGDWVWLGHMNWVRSVYWDVHWDFHWVWDVSLNSDRVGSWDCVWYLLGDGHLLNVAMVQSISWTEEKVSL